MSYEKQTWTSGEIITAEKLNNLEEGVQEALAGSDKTLIITIETELFDPDQYNSYGSQEGVVEIPLKSITLSEGSFENLMKNSSIIESYDIIVTKIITNTQRSGVPFSLRNILYARTAYTKSPFGDDISFEANYTGIYTNTSAIAFNSYSFAASINNDNVQSQLTHMASTLATR